MCRRRPPEAVVREAIRAGVERDSAAASGIAVWVLRILAGCMRIGGLAS
jgi:predicted transcriptional regulator